MVAGLYFKRSEQLLFSTNITTRLKCWRDSEESSVLVGIIRKGFVEDFKKGF